MKAHRQFALLLLSISLTTCIVQPVKTLLMGDDRELRSREGLSSQSNAPYNDILLLLIDGTDRDLLYQLLRDGQMPETEKLLGSLDESLLDQRYLSVLPSSTAVAWSSALTGEKPSVHGVSGNEFFVRETGFFAAPVAVTVDAMMPALAAYNDDYLNKMLMVPTVYEQVRFRDPSASIWVAMHPIFRGADRLLMTDRGILLNGVRAFAEVEIRKNLSGDQTRELFEALDAEVIDQVMEAMDEHGTPDVLTVYLPGTDQLAHVSTDGPLKSRTGYLTEVVDPLLGALRKKLEDAGELENRYVVITSDHGHSEVTHDDQHALGLDLEQDPPALLKAAGFRLRPFEHEVAEDHDFQAVLAYQGAMAYVYLADRSGCQTEGQRCDWNLPPRFDEDVLAAAEVIWRNNETGDTVSAMRDTLDMVLVRKPEPFWRMANEFEVYIGNSKTQSVSAWLADNPRPNYVDFEARMKELAIGPLGHRAGDLLLIAHNGNVTEADQRYYFASLYHSWHGSPSKQDSELPLVVAHPERNRADIQQLVDEVFADSHYQQQLTPLLLKLRFDTF